MTQQRIVSYIIMGLLFTVGVSDALAAKVKEGKVSEELAPMPEPEYKVGYKSHELRDGKQMVWEITASGTGKVTWEGSDGCSITNAGYFSPLTEWKNCDTDINGTQEVDLKGGDVWPLKVGNKFEYKIKGINVEKQTWANVYKCKVKDQVRIKTVSGEHDTYKVICASKRITKTWYMSPELGTYVYYLHKHHKTGTKRFEVTKFESP